MKKLNDHFSVLHNSRPTIAVLIGSMSSSFQEGIMRGAADVAAENDINIIGFSGGPYNSPDPLAQSRETLFDLVDTRLIDGVIVPVSSHTRYLNQRETQAFLAKFKDIPLVNIGGTFEGYPNINPDYRSGLSELLKHLVMNHGYKRIALFRGPSHHDSSNQREAIYREVLSSYDLPVDEDLIIYSDLRRNAGEKAVSELFGKVGDSVAAIVCVNDGLAFGVMDALKERGLKIPEDIAVTGSMDIPGCLFTEPPLTSIQEPLYELGRQAVYKLLNAMDGVQGNTILKIPTKPVYRESCGCTNLQTIRSYKSNPSPRTGQSPEKAIDTAFKTIQRRCFLILSHHRCDDFQVMESLMPLYRQAALKQKHRPFISALRDRFKAVVKINDIIPWLKIVSELQMGILQLVADGHQTIEGVLDLTDSLSLLKDEFEHNAIVYQSFDTDFYINFFREIVNNLNSSFDLNAVRNFAVRLLELTDLSISVYDKKSGSLTMAYNVLTVRNRQSADIPEGDRLFESKGLLPQSIASFTERYSLMVFPLSFRKKPLGFLLMNLSKRKGSAFENMQAIISTALKNELQFRELKEAESRFSDIAHSTSDWLWETDAKHRFTYSSGSSLEVLGYDEEELLDRTISDLSVSEGLNFYSIMMQHEHLTGVECWFRHKNSEMVCLMMSAKPIVRDDAFIGYRGVFKDITAEKMQADKIKYLAYNDILTGLPNRTLFNEHLACLTASGRKNDNRFALMFLDMDRFKYINDSMGHAAGDELLKMLAGRLKSSLRSNDILARLGGDEFTILLPSIQHDLEVTRIAERILEKTAPSVTINGKEIFMTISIGIAMYPADGKTESILLKNADTAMYRAKSQGRNRYVFYDRDLEEKNVSRIASEEILYRALKDDLFYMDYQPKVSTANCTVTGFESLIRIRHPEHGIIAPGSFIPLAEELGLIGRVDEKAFTLVCLEYSRWVASGLTPPKIAVNLSPLQLKNPGVVARYMNIAKRLDVDPKDIQLEITENALIENEAMALDILTGFKKEGFGIALDDFGIGYSSLSSIQIYPFDTVKIDRSFIRDLTDNPVNQAIISAIIHMAKSLNLKVVAEGVEASDQLRLLTEFGCHEIQGYYFSKPVSSDEALVMMDEGFRFDKVEEEE